MSENVIVATDCISDLTKELTQKYQIASMYYYICTEKARFQDTYEMTSDDLIEYIDVDLKKAYSQCASVEEYIEFFDKLQNGTDRAVVYVCSSKHVTQSYNISVEAAKQLSNVYVVDSGQLSAGTGILALEAAEMAFYGASAEMIVQEMKEMSQRVSTSFILDSVEYLYNSRRMSKFVYHLCKTLSLHPVLKMKDGQLRPVAMCVGKKQRYAKSYIKWVLKRKDDIVKDRGFLISVGCSHEYLEYIKKEIGSRVTWDKFVENAASATVSCNCGPGTFGILFMRKKKVLHF